MISDIVKDIHFINILANRFNLQKKASRLWNGRCPMCGDSKKKRTKKRFFFLEKKGKMMAYCHNCGNGHLVRTFIKEYAPDLLEEYNFHGFKESIKPEESSKILNKLKELSEKPKKESPILSVSTQELFSLTKSFASLKKDHPARILVDKRQLPYDKIRYCTNFYKLTKSLHQGDTFKDYAIASIIIPFLTATEQIELFQARFFDPKITPKYLTVKLNPDALKLYNKDFVDQSRTVYVLEGPIDSFFVENSVAMAGSDVEIPFKNAVFVYDNEPFNAQINTKIEKKITENKKVVIWNSSFKFKDINQGLQDKTLDFMYIQSILKNRTFSGLKARLEFSKYKSGG